MVGTYTVMVAHWFKSSFTGNNAPFNTNGIQLYTDETETNDRSLSVFKYSQKVSVVYTGKILYEKNLICTRKNMYVHKECWFGTYTVREAHWFKRSSLGIFLLFEPMDSVYKQTKEV